MDKEINNKMVVMEEMRDELIADDMNGKCGILLTDLKVQECEENLSRKINSENKSSTAKLAVSECKQVGQSDSEKKHLCTEDLINKSDSNTTGSVNVENKTCEGNELADVEKDDKVPNHNKVTDGVDSSQNDVLGYEKVKTNSSNIPCFANRKDNFSVDKLISKCKLETHSVAENQCTIPELSTVQSLKYNRSEKGDSHSCLHVDTRNDGSPLLKQTLIGLHNGSLEQTKVCKSSYTTGTESPLKTMSTICTNSNNISSSAMGCSDYLNQSQHNSVSQKIGLNSHYPNLSKALSDPKIDLMQFAERLYKCTLCTSIPSILTSRSSFLQHVQEQHLNTHGCFKHCKMCSLKFHTEEDLKEHVLSYHVNNLAPFKDKPTNNVAASASVSDTLDTKLPSGSPETNNCVKPSSSPSLECIRSTIVSSLNNLPSVRTSDIIKSADTLVDNESDSDSSGHRQFKAKVVRRTKPQYDFENPKQLVDHAGIETLDGSLDLTKKVGNEDQSRCSVISINHDRNSPRMKEEVNLASVQQITEQIMKSNAAQTKGSTTKIEQKYGFVPSFTPEFGKFTKLVREGGNIVYFCQVCNWKSPVKTTFQSHCTLNSHKNKVASAEDSDTGGCPEQNAKTGPKMSKTSSMSNDSASAGNRTNVGCSKDADPWSTANGQNSVSKLAERNSVFYDYIRQRRSQHANRTPVVSMFGNGLNSQSEFTYRFPQEHEAAFLSKKKKRPLSYMRNTSQKLHNSESDSDDSKASGDHESQWKCHSVSASELLRSKILRGYLSSERQDLKNSSFDRCSQQAFDNEEMAPNKNFPQETPNVNMSLVKTEKMDPSECGKHMLPVLNSQKRHSTSPVDTSNKRYKHEQEEQGNGAVKDSFSTSYRFMPNKCSICSYGYSDIDDYEKHFAKDHAMDGVSLPAGPFPSHALWGDIRGGSDGRAGMYGKQEELGMRQSSDSAEMGENWRVQKLKDILSDYLVASEAANVSRDYLLQCVSVSSDLSEAVLWSSACNKAIRELFPSSLARRKGKYKKYYFGVAMAEPLQGQEEMALTEVEGQLYQPRDVSADMEVIMEQLPSIVKWTGCMERGVYRADVLAMLAKRLGDREAEGWGAQCNRAIRLVYPMVDMKRKGKYKTTIYFGVDFKKRIKQTFMQMHLDSQPTAGPCEDPMRLKPPVFTETEEQPPSANLDSLPTSRAEASSETGAPGIVSDTSVPGMVSETGAPGMVYPKWFKQEAERQMGQYLARFGGVSVYDDPGGSGDADDDDNDGDDEAGSVESGVTG